MPLTALLPLLISLSATTPLLPAEPAAVEHASSKQEGAAHRAKGDSSNNKNGKKKGKKNGKNKKNGNGDGDNDKPGKITGAEFRNSAQTLKKGTFLIHPLFEPSSYAISNKAQLVMPLLGQLFGPQVGLRYKLLDKQGQVASVEPFVSSDWQFSAVQAGANVRYTKEIGKNRLNLGAGAAVYTTLAEVETAAGDSSALSSSDLPSGTGLASTNLEVGYDLVVKPKTTWRFELRTDPYYDAQGSAYAVIGANWNHSVSDTFRVSLGLAAFVGANPLTDIAAALDIDLPALAVLPLPTVELWWKF